MNIHTLNINSKDRSQGSSHNFSINLTNGINNIKSFSIGDIIIPKTYYNIKSDETLFFSDNDGLKEVSIPLGNYDIFQIMTFLSVNMNDISTHDYKFNLDQISNKINIQYQEVFQLDFAFSPCLAQYLGFGRTVDNDEILFNSGIVLNPLGLYEINAPNSPNTQRTRNIFIISSDIHRQNYTFNKNQSLGHIITSVIDDVEFGQLITKREINNLFIKFAGNNTLTSMRFKLVDDNGEILDLNGVDWSFTLNLHVTC